MLLLLSDCPGTRDDLFAWARQSGNEILYTETRTGGVTAYYLRRGRSESAVANVRLDLRGAACPGPIIEARRLLDGLTSGEVLQIASDRPGVADDVAAWADAMDIELLDARQTGAETHEFLLGKR